MISILDSTVGIVGLGSIGTAVMERLIPFGVKRIVYSGRTKKDVKSSIDVDFVSFEELLEQSDFVIVTCSYYPELKHLFNKVKLTEAPLLSVKSLLVCHAGRLREDEEVGRVDQYKPRRDSEPR